MNSLNGRAPRICRVCIVGGIIGAKSCSVRNSVLAETGHDVRCEICGVEPSPIIALINDEQDRWWCVDHMPDQEG